MGFFLQLSHLIQLPYITELSIQKEPETNKTNVIY